MGLLFHFHHRSIEIGDAKELLQLDETCCKLRKLDGSLIHSHQQ